MGTTVRGADVADVDLSVMSSLAFGAERQSHSMSPTRLFGFSLGMIGDRIFRDAPALLLLLFMTNFLAIPPALAGSAIFVPKLLIVLVDPMVGILSDRMKSRPGGRLPMMVAGALITSISLVLFFHVPPFGHPATTATYLGIIIFLGFSGYSLFSVPYLVMASEIASDDEERRRIMSWRVAFMAIGLSFSAFAGGIVEALGGGMAGYSRMSWIYAAACLVTMLATIAGTLGARVAPAGEAPGSGLAQLRAFIQNRRFFRLLSVGLLQKLGEGVGYSSFAYFCIYVVQQPLHGIGLVVFSATAGQILAQPLWLKASRRLSPPNVYALGTLGWIGNLWLWLLMKGQSEWWLIPLGLQAGAAAGGLLMVTLGLLSTTMAADARETGLNREGIFSGVWLATEKAAFALGALLVGLILGLFGFVESAGGATVAQSSTAVFGIAFAYVGLNSLIYLVSIAVIRGHSSAVR